MGNITGRKRVGKTLPVKRLEIKQCHYHKHILVKLYAYVTQPKAQTSASKLCPLFCRTSGAI